MAAAMNDTHVDELMGEPVEIAWSQTIVRKYKSLAHVWSEWYREYLDADFPRLIVRFEDLIFHAPAVLEQIRECVGAVWKEEDFVFLTQCVCRSRCFVFCWSLLICVVAIPCTNLPTSLLLCDDFVWSTIDLPRRQSTLQTSRRKVE
jgi:hypothetical protein